MQKRSPVNLVEVLSANNLFLGIAYSLGTALENALARM